MLGQQSSLNSRSCSFSLVLNDNELELFKNARYIVHKITDSEIDWVFIACIMHDNDFDRERNCYKTIHYHLVLTFTSVHRVDSIINYLSDLFHCNRNQISCEKCNSVAMQVRYLIHLDDFDKYKYNVADIVTNRQDLVAKYLNRRMKIADVEDLFSIMRQYPILQDLIGYIGVENYKKWRCVIQDLRKERF